MNPRPWRLSNDSLQQLCRVVEARSVRRLLIGSQLGIIEDFEKLCGAKGTFTTSFSTRIEADGTMST